MGIQSLQKSLRWAMLPCLASSLPFHFPSVGNHSFLLSCQMKSSRRQVFMIRLWISLVPAGAQDNELKNHASVLNLDGGSSWNKLSGKREKFQRGTGMKMGLSHFFDLSPSISLQFHRQLHAFWEKDTVPFLEVLFLKHFLEAMADLATSHCRSSHCVN